MKLNIKSIFLASCLMAMAFVTQAQTTLVSNSNGSGLDTVTNTGVKIMSVKLTGFRETVTATVLFTKLTGTMGGTAVPVGSDDGVNWHDISQIAKDTVTVPNSTTFAKGFNFQRGWGYYGIQWTGTGTMAATMAGKLIARKSTD